MSIESDLRKDGITVISALDSLSISTIAESVSEKFVKTFPNLGFDYNTLYNRFSNLPMYSANIPEGMSEASYFYKNSAIYFRDGMGLSDIEKYSVHEFIHNLQEIKDERGNLVRLGLCNFKGAKVKGMGLNEAAVQFMASNILGYTFENVTYYGITFSTISTSCYPILCNLIYQMAYITGEEVLFDSTINSNEHFKNRFSALCGTSAYSQLSNLFDRILNIEEKIIKLENKIQNTDLSFAKSEAIYDRIAKLKERLRNAYFSAQETIIKSYCSNLLKNIVALEDLDTLRKKLYNFQELIGTTSNYSFFNDYYIEMMEKLDERYEALSNPFSTYLVPRRETAFSKVMNYIRKLLWKGNKENIRS